MSDLKFKELFAWLLIIFGGFVGFISLAILLYFYAKYFTCNGIGCSELMMGPAVASLFGGPSWAAISIGVFLLSSKVKKKITVTTYLITVFMLFVLMYFLVIY